MDTLFDSRDLSRNELAAETIRSFGELRLRVTGSSMLPAVRPDDVLLVCRCRSEDVAPGDVVLYIRQRRLFAHRVLSRSSAQVVTQGDAIAQADPPVSTRELLGKIVRVLRRGKAVSYESKSTSPRRLAALLFRRSAGACRLFTRLQGLRRRVHR